MTLPPDFAVDFVSDTRYEELMVEVSYKKQRLFQLNKKNGLNSIEIEFTRDIRLLPGTVDMVFPFVDFQNILAIAKDALVNEC